MEGHKAAHTINGTYGEAWIDGEYMADVTALEASVDFDKTEINQPRILGTQYKVLGYSGKGTLKLNKVTSYFQKRLSDDIKAGRQTSCVITSKLDDPDAFGAERVVLKDVVFDGLTLANWEAKKAGEESISFTFTDWDYLDTI